MSREHIELKVRSLRAQLGERLRSGAPVIARLRRAIDELEGQTAMAERGYLRERLQSLLDDWHITLLVRANPWLILQREFYRPSAQVVSPGLLGNVIITGDGRAARIAEVVACDDAPPANALAPIMRSRTQLAGRLFLSHEHGAPRASILCGHASGVTMASVTRIEPLEGIALMVAEGGELANGAGTFQGEAVVHALGLGHRHHGADLTRRQSPVRIASLLQASPLAIGQPRRSRRAPSGREWRWTLPRHSP